MFDAILSRTSRLMISSLFPLAALLGLLPAASALAAAPAQEAVHPNVRIVQEYYAQYAKGNLEGMRALMAPDVEWTLPRGQRQVRGGCAPGLGLLRRRQPGPQLGAGLRDP